MNWQIEQFTFQNNKFTRTSSRFCLFLLASAWLACLTVPPAAGQVYQFDGGTSTLFQATGGSMHVRTLDSEAALGFGFLNGKFNSGGIYRRQWGSSILTLGDDPIPVRLPTDLFDSSHYFFGRGASVAIKKGSTRVFTFAGLTSDGSSAPFFPGGNFGNGTGALFIDHQISSKLHLSSRNIFSSRQTSISGLEWRPIAPIILNAAAGVGANQRYLGTGATIETAPLSLRAGYVDAGQNFQRVLVTTPLTTENTGGNVLITVRPRRFLDLSTAHFSLTQPATLSNGPVNATLNHSSATLRAKNTTFSGSLYRSETAGIGASGSALSISRVLATPLQASASLFHSREDHGSSLTSMVMMLREMLCSRFTLSQLVNHTNGSTNLSWGGEFLSNPISVGVDYQTVYSPFFPKSPFRQVLLFSLHLQPTHLFQVTSATFVGIDGSVKYTTYGGLLGYRGQADPAGPSHFKFPRYLVQGTVLDQNGLPVRGAALRIEKELVFTDQDGGFFVRRKSRRPVRLEVALREFAVAGSFSVRSCPSVAVPSLADADAAIVVLLQRFPNGAVAVP